MKFIPIPLLIGVTAFLFWHFNFRPSSEAAAPSIIPASSTANSEEVDTSRYAQELVGVWRQLGTDPRNGASTIEFRSNRIYNERDSGALLVYTRAYATSTGTW